MSDLGPLARHLHMTPGELYGTLECAAIFTRLLGEALRRLNWAATDPSGEYREQEWHYAVQGLRDASRFMQGRETRHYGRSETHRYE